MKPPALIPLVFAALAAALPSAVLAQGFEMSKSGDQQIQVYADNGIEWHSEELRVIARGKAHAVRGNMTVDADVLTAHYRKGPKGDEIWRLDADGNVVIRSPGDTATGHKAIYDLDKSIFVLKGTPAKLVTATDTFQASDSLEYWELKKMAVLRGDAIATQDGSKTLKGDVLTAHFKDKDKSATSKAGARPAQGGQPGEGGGSLELQRADAYGHVMILSGNETVTGDRGDYNAETGIATVSGSVKISREGGNQLEGGWAHVNLNTGVSKLFPVAAGGTDSGQRVQGVFIPQKKDKGGPQDGQPQGRAGFTGNAPTPGSGER
ncbi:LptA/OstA family protein [Magnetospirillum sp. 15-1]|uniref:LptA/OstA family protein n=1 Tax=Magnetospirillum sp. 15-1 TaxID=1979370 RepID=UPI000BBC8A61|nr:LptA/OstA family protein [Magnetospirillum sp. 15-1]